MAPKTALEQVARSEQSSADRDAEGVCMARAGKTGLERSANCPGDRAQLQRLASPRTRATQPTRLLG